jgi:hypothetical protein
MKSKSIAGVRQRVFLVTHVNSLPNGEDDMKFIGAYKSKKDAEAAVTRSALLLGFRDSPLGFSIDEYSLGEDHWTEGFITWMPDSK